MKRILHHNMNMLSRRAFLRRSAALGFTSLLPSQAFGENVEPPSPQKGGQLRMGLAGAALSDSLDPATISGSFMTNLSFGQLRNNLVELDAQGNLVPELAESWQVSADAKQWRFQLHTGVEFHHGKSLDAHDVIASFNHHRGKDSISAVKSLLDNIESIEADGKHRVVFTLQTAQADFSYVLTDYHLTIQPAGEAITTGIGTGAYRLVDLEPGVRALTERNPNYWKANRAHFDTIEMLAIPDVNARTTALQTGELDLINRCELKTAHLLKQLPSVQVLQTTGSKHYSLPMFTDVAPFDNNHVRLALKYGIDRQALLTTILRGYGSLGNDQPIGRTQRYFATELPQRQYDPERAQFHLKRAGFDQLTVQLSTSDIAFSGAVDTAVLYREHAAKAGINIEVVREPADGYWENVWLKKPFCLCTWAGRPTPDFMFTLAYAAGSAWNDTHFRHAHFNQLLIAARAELDEPKRSEMYAEMQRIVHDEGGVIIPLFAADVFAANARLRFGPLAGDLELDGAKCAERWWWG
jgi:peptide/nickel transport system substrate-binding protein